MVLEEYISACPICNGTQFKSIMVCKDHTVSHETFSLMECNKCLFTFTNPRPAIDQLENYYLSDNYISHTNKATGLIDKIYLQARKYTLRKKLKLLNNISNEKRVLDYGCGTGAFLNYCKNNGWAIGGIEPATKARTQAIQLTQADIVPSISEIKGTYGVITLWHVLEHIPDFKEKLTQIKQLLSTEGKLVIAVPNLKSYDAHHYKEYWAAYDVPRHLWHFSQTDMQSVLEQQQLKLLTVIPMKLDSFYVSMLSEKYKNNAGLQGLTKAFLVGLKSNMKAGSSNNYSSLIYVAQK
jgi:SAM-dependent methyltransferase